MDNNQLELTHEKYKPSTLKGTVIDIQIKPYKY